MKRGLERKLAKLGLLSTLLFMGCNTNSSNEDILRYAQKSAERMREGYYSVENLNVQYRNLDGYFEVLDDTTYRNLIFTNTPEATNEILKSFNGFYHSGYLDDDEAILLKDGKIFSLYFENENLDGKLRNVEKSEIIPPVILLDNNKLLVNYNYLIRFSDNGPFKGKAPILSYRTSIFERTYDGLFIDPVEIRGRGYNCKTNTDLFGKLKDNSSVNIAIWGKLPRYKKDLLVNNPKAYKTFSPIITELSDF